MNLLELRNSLTAKQFNNLYIFTGQEYTILDIYIQKVADGIGCQVTNSDFVSSVYKSLDKKDMFGSSKKVYVVKYDKEFLSSEVMWKDLEQKLKRKNNYLILKYTSLDQRSKFYKKFESKITDFQPLSVEVLTKYIKKEVDITDSCCAYLCEISNNDYGRILLDIDKVKNLAQRKNISDMDSFKECYNSNAFHIDAEGEMNDLVDAIMDRDIKGTYELLSESKQRNDNPLAIISFLHNKVRCLLQLQTAGNIKNLAETTGLTGFQIKNSKPFVGRYTEKELVRFMKYLRYCEQGIKNGRIESDNAIDYLLVNIL